MSEQDQDLPQSEDLELKVKELEEKWKRALADYQNLSKRTAEEKNALVGFLTVGVLGAFLPLYDSLKRAVVSSKDSGYSALLKQFLEILKEFEVEVMVAEECDFDPQRHEALEMVEGGVENKISEVIRDGFVLGSDRVLRPAQVKVYRGKKEEKEIKEEKHE